AGANPNAARSTGETPLMTASRTGSLEAVKSLLAHGATATAKEPTEGQTALMWAISERHADIARVLIEAGADVRARAASGFTPLPVEQRVAGVNAFSGATPFLLAAMAGDTEVMRALAAGGADPRLKTKDDTTALMLAAGLGRYLAESRVTEPQALEAVKVIVGLGA